jgi:general L-amino acid transport system substrate-binding protein
VAQGTTSELNLADHFRKLGLKYEPAAFGTSEEALKAYEAGRCDVYTTDVSALSAVRLKLQDVDNHVILPEVISKEPLGPWVRTGDESWFNLVRFTVLALINAEELGVTKANVKEMLKSDNPEIRRFLGLEGKFGEGLGLTNDWVVRIVATVGNYGESFERHLGKTSALKLDRGPNALWTKGGLQYSPPFR